jgi:hypothetical protein
MGKTRAVSPKPGITFDAGALIALDRGDRRIIALIAEALKQGRAFRVPAGVVGQAWRDGKRQANLARFLRALEVCVVALDEPLSRACGELCGRAGTDDVIDASVVMTARLHHDVVVTSDSSDLRRLDSNVSLVAI